MEHYPEITIVSSLTYNTVKPIMKKLSGVYSEIKLIKCDNIEEIDITGIQFLISAKKYSNNIEIQTDFSVDISDLVQMMGYKL